MKVVAVIPCYNEGAFIWNIVVLALPFCALVVVSDDASTDNTIQEALRAGAIVCRR